MALGAFDKNLSANGVLIRSALAVAFSLAAAAVCLILDANNLVFVGDLDTYLGDWRIALFARRAPEQRPDIAIVLISEETLFDYPARSPIDRGLLADLVRTIDAANPKAIGLDFIFDRRTLQDKALQAAIREARSPIVLGAIDERENGVSKHAFDIQDAFLNAAALRPTGARHPVGHLYLAEKPGGLSLSDQAVRQVADAPSEHPERKAFSTLLAEIDGPKPREKTDEISWLLPPPDGRTSLFWTFRVPTHKPEERRTGLPGIFLPSQLSALSGRVVLIGGEMANTDIHQTPLTVRDGKPVAGVFIHAQRLAQVRDGRYSWGPPLPVKFAIVASVCLVCFAMGRRLMHQTQIYDGIGLLLLGLISIGLFALTELVLPSAVMLLAWLVGFRAGRYSSKVFEWLGLKS